MLKSEPDFLKQFLKFGDNVILITLLKYITLLK